MIPPASSLAGDFVMPAEWEPQRSIWLAWPHNTETWPGDGLARVQETYAEVIRHIGREQGVGLLVSEESHEHDTRRILADLDVDTRAVRFLHIPTCDTWIRDYGPTFVVDRRRRRLAMVSWQFNAWGGKYPEFFPDDEIPDVMGRCLDIPVMKPGIVMEGGSVDVNGRGLLMTTEQCLLNPNRNPDLGRADIEQYLGRYLGALEVIWLGEGIVGDDTDGHIDDIARFISADTVVCAVEQDASDENFEPLRNNYERLTGFRDRQGRPLQVIALPMPGALVKDGVRLPASYANFYIGNRSVLVPTFGHTNDELALEILRGCFPERAVVGIDCTVLVEGLGTLHCCSQQEPAI